MKKIIVLFVLFCSLLFAKSNDTQSVTLRLLWLNQFEFAGYYMALEKGYYKDAGIDLKIKEYEFGVDITQEVLSGKSEFGIESSSIILEKMQGKDVFLLLAGFQESPFVLMTKKREDIQTIQDLKGKKIMVAPNQVTMATLNAMLQVNNVYEGDYEAIKHSFDTHDLIANKVDAMSTYVSNEPFHLQKEGIEYTIFDPADYGFSFYTNILFTSKEFYKQNPKLVKKFYEATVKGWLYSFENINEAVDLIYNRYNTQQKSKAHLLFEAKELKERAFTQSGEFGKFKEDKIDQIAQTYQLLKLSSGTVNFEDFIYEKAIYQEGKIDYSLLIKIALGVGVLFLGFYYWNRKLARLNHTIKTKSQKIATLLNNSKQGFLTFDRDFLIDDEYSKECTKLLGNDIEGKDITIVLFEQDSKRLFFKNTIECAIKEKTKLAQNSILSLLPDMIILYKRALQIEYKILESDKIMLIITNISKQMKLEKKVKKEQEVLKMVVAVVSQSETFYDLKNDFFNFVDAYAQMIDPKKSPKENLEILYRIVHTFKGIFAQLYMNSSVAKLHELESQLSEFKQSKYKNENLLALLERFGLENVLEDDLCLLQEILGDEFLGMQRYVKIDYKDIVNLQKKITALAQNDQYQSPECQDIVAKIQEFSSYKLSTLLKPYEGFVAQLAQRLEKSVRPLVVKGDDEMIVSHRYKPMIKSLIHIFRNALDHGIEDEESRLMKDKDEFATIGCSYGFDKDDLYIKISDDGQGIDIEKLKQNLAKKGIKTQNLTKQQLLDHIFADSFSTSTSVTELSGRGVGLSAVKKEVEDLGGTIEVQTQKDSGTTFVIRVPFE